VRQARVNLPRVGLALIAALVAPVAGIPAAASSLGTETFAIENARIVTGNGPVIERGTVLVRAGKIAAVGASVDVPADARRIDAAGLSVYPGMIDSVTQLGLLEVASIRATNDVAEIGEFNPHLRAYEAFNSNSEFIPVARIAGVTTAVSMPGGGVLSGQPFIVDLAGSTVDEMALRPTVGLAFNFPSAVGASSFDFDAFQQRRVTDTEAKRQRDRKLDEIRDLLRDAEAYARALDAREKDPSLPVMKRDLRLASLRPFVRGELPVIIEANDERDIRVAVDFADEMKLKMILRSNGASDAGKVAPLLAQKKIPVVLGPMYTLPLREDDRYDMPQQTPLALQRAGVRFALATNDAAMVKDLPYNAAMAVAYGGLTKEDALRAITIWPAEIWGVADRVGSIEVGKYANLMVTTGDPLEIRTDVRHVFIEGKEIPLVSRQTRFYEQYKIP
jgi:imidazolonepropionase-like amidohydrolase